MSETPKTAEQDLAFLRQLVQADDGLAWRRAFGRTYAMWGAAFAIPLLFEWARWEGLIELPKNFWVWAAAVATLGLTVVSLWGSKRWGPVTGAQSKAALAIFAGVGWANVAVLIALVLVAYGLKDGRVMMLHAVVVFAFQGAAWYAVWVLRKRLWTGLVAAGWYVGAILTGLTLGTPTFILMCALAMLLLMVAPGVVMMRERA